MRPHCGSRTRVQLTGRTSVQFSGAWIVEVSGLPDPNGMPKNRSRAGRLVRIVFLIGALTAISVVLAASASAAASHQPSARQLAHAKKRSTAKKQAHAASATPAQGIFDTCSLSQTLTTCEQDLLQMHRAGMQVVVISVLGVSLQQIQNYAGYAQSVGMSVMWAINDPGYWGGAWIGSGAAGDWNQFSSACGCSGNGQVLHYMIKWLAALPATYGYYAADDSLLTSGQVGGLRQYVNAIKSVDPNHMVMVGSNQSQGTTYYQTGATIGNEIYPETTNSLVPASRNLATWDSVQQSVGQDQRAATRAGTPSAFILQAFSFGDSLADGEAVGACTPRMTQSQCAGLLRYPDAGVQLELRNQVLQHANPKLILWFTFSQATEGDHWAALSRVVNASYPAVASAARAKRSARKAARKRRSHPHERRTQHRSVPHGFII